MDLNGQAQKAGFLRAITGLAFICLFASDPASAAAPRDRTLNIGGVNLHFRLTPGCGPTVVLESGGGLDASQWAHLQPQLSDATGAAIVSYDRAGFGDSELPKGPFTLEQQVQ